MPLPFLVTCSVPAVKLYELTDGRFQLIEQGPIAPLMIGYRYVLVEEGLAKFLQSLPLERIRYENVTLFNRGTAEEVRTHIRIRVGQFFEASQIQDIALSGLRILTMNDEYIFVSPELKRELEASGFKYLRFSEGLSGFAASAA